MKISFELDAEFRDDQGKGASRRLRRLGKVPAILYGGKRDARALLDAMRGEVAQPAAAVQDRLAPGLDQRDLAPRAMMKRRPVRGDAEGP